MNQPQQDAIDDCIKVLGEHFDTFFLAVSWKNEKGDASSSEMFYGDDYHACLGLASRAVHKMIRLEGEEEDSEGT